MRGASVAALCLATGAAAAEPARAGVPPPIAWQEPAPVARLFLQLPFEDPEVVDPGRTGAALRLLYSNTLLAAATGALALDVHVETAQPTVFLRHGLAPRIEAQLALPFVVDYGGVLDRPIEVVERWFGFTNPQRQGRPRGVRRYQLTRADGRGILATGAAVGLGDAWAGVKVQVVGAAFGPSFALRGAVKLPTGRVPFGSEEVDAGAGALAAWAWRTTALRLEVDTVLPTSRLAAVGLATRPYGAIDVGLTHAFSSALAAHAQLSAHGSPLGGTGIAQLDDPTFYALAGVTVAASRHAALELALVENVFSPYRGADVTFVLALRRTP